MAASVACGRIQRGLGLLKLRLRQDVRVIVLLGPLIVELGLLRRRARADEIVAHRRQARLAAGCLRRELRLVDLEEELPFLDTVSLGDGEVGDLTHHESGQVHLAAGLDLAVGGHLGEQVDLFDLRGRDVRKVAIPAGDRKSENRPQTDDETDRQDDLGFLRHALPPSRARAYVLVVTREVGESSPRFSRAGIVISPVYRSFLSQTSRSPTSHLGRRNPVRRARVRGRRRLRTGGRR